MSGLQADAVRVLAPHIYEGGGTSPQTGTGGSTNYGPNTVKLNQFSAFFVLFLILFKICIGRTPPAPVCALGHPPHKCGGQGRLRRQPAKFQFVEPHGDTERVRAEATTDHVRHGLAAGTAGHDLAARSAGQIPIFARKNDTERRREEATTHIWRTTWLPALRAKFSIISMRTKQPTVYTMEIRGMRFEALFRN